MLAGLGAALFAPTSALALTGCAADGELDLPELLLATGPEGAVYRRIGGLLAEILDRQLDGTTVTALPSRASTDNIRMLRSGQAHLGLANLDAALGLDGEPPADVVALCRIFDSHLHLVVLAESPIRSVADLNGRRVSYGAPDSGTDFTARRLIELAEVDVEPAWLSQAESATALDAEEIDAAFSLTGVPTPAISELAERRPIRLVPMPHQAAALADAYPGPYFPATIPATAYRGVPACPTLAIPNLLLARADIPEAVAHVVTATILTDVPTAASDVPEATQINVRTAIATGPVPLHPGAVTWYREEKL